MGQMGQLNWSITSRRQDGREVEVRELRGDQGFYLEWNGKTLESSEQHGDKIWRVLNGSRCWCFMNSKWGPGVEAGRLFRGCCKNAERNDGISDRKLVLRDQREPLCEDYSCTGIICPPGKSRNSNMELGLLYNFSLPCSYEILVASCTTCLLSLATNVFVSDIV